MYPERPCAKRYVPLTGMMSDKTDSSENCARLLSVITDSRKAARDAQQVKSRQRVADFGEVFTAECEVNAMLDIVKAEMGRIESRFLEPACGNGNFIAEVLLGL